MDNSTDLDGTILNWTWDFGDGKNAFSNQTHHVYISPGIYNASLVVTDNDGDTNRYIVRITVEEDKGNTSGFEIAVIIGAMVLSIFVLKRK